jgi:diguanylate cyclase (GGDEF)-like protein
VARYCDDTFVVLLPDDTQDTATALAERIRQAVASMGVRHAASAASRYVTVSIGVARWPAQVGTAAEAMLQAAEQAMSEAKAAGRNRVVQTTGPVNQVVA